MKSVVAFGFVSLLTSIAFAQSSLNIEIKVKGTDRYVMATGNLARGETSDATTTVQVSGKGVFASNNLTLGPYSETQPNTTDITEIGKESVRMEDHASNVSRTVKANVSRSLFRRELKTLIIPSEEMKLILGDHLSKMGKEFVQRMSIGDRTGSMKYNLELSDYSCQALDARLSCDYEANISISLEAKR
jgi:hypothetical protein